MSAAAVTGGARPASRQRSLWAGRRRQPLPAAAEPALGSPEWYASLSDNRPVGPCARCGFEATLYHVAYSEPVCHACMVALAQEADANIRRYVAEHPDRSDVTKNLARKWGITNA